MGIDTLISAAGFSVGLMLAGLVASAPKQVAPGGRWLAAALLCFALLSLSDCLESSRLILKSPHLGHIFDPLSLLLGPLLLAYVHTLTGRALPPWPRALTHTIPLLLVTTLLVPFYLMSSAEKRATLELDLSQQAAIDPILAVVAIIFFCYLVAALRLLSRYRRELPDNYSSLEQRTYRLIGAMLWILSGLWIIFVLAVVGAGEWAQWLNRVAVPVAMYGLGWFGLRQRLVRIDHQPAATTMTMLKPTETSEVPTVEATTPANAPAFTHSIVAPVPPVGTDSPPKYQRSGLTTERAAFYRTRLEESMATDKPYLENDLTLAQLAGRIGISAHHLSQLFNEQLGQTFFDYVNAKRVEDVKRCLADRAYDGQAILTIALDAGFNSKTAFNTAFRKHTGQTPSAFRAALCSNMNL